MSLGNWSAWISSVSSVAQLCLTLCNHMDCSTPGFPVHHQLSVLAQTHVHQVGDDIQPSHPLSSHSPPALSLSQHQGLFQWVSSSHQVAKVLKFQLQLSPSNEYSGLISLRIDWFDPLAVQGTLDGRKINDCVKDFKCFIFTKGSKLDNNIFLIAIGCRWWQNYLKMILYGR